MGEQRYIVRLNRVDLLTLSAVVTSSAAVSCALSGRPYLAISFLYLATLGDALDGMLARRWELVRNFGRYLDGFMDTLIYLVVPSLILYLWGFDGIWSPCLMLMIACGCIRLAVFNEVGNVRADDGLAYLGMPVFWSIFLLGGFGVLHPLLDENVLNPLMATGLVAFSHAMLRQRQFYKFERLSEILGLTVGGMTLFGVLHLFVDSGVAAVRPCP